MALAITLWPAEDQEFSTDQIEDDDGFQGLCTLVGLIMGSSE